jgi:hypothetical protein
MVENKRARGKDEQERANCQPQVAVNSYEPKPEALT